MNDKPSGKQESFTDAGPSGKLPFQFACSLLVAVVICAAACGKAPPSTSAAQFEKGFAATDANIREFARQGVDAESKGDFNTAFRHYRALSNNPDLTAEQRNLAQNAMLEMTKQLSKSATNGDAEAAMNMQMYRMTR